MIYVKIAQAVSLNYVRSRKTPEGIPDNEGGVHYDRNQTAWHFALETEDIGTLIRSLVEQGIDIYRPGPAQTGKQHRGCDLGRGMDAGLPGLSTRTHASRADGWQVGQTMQRKHDAGVMEERARRFPAELGIVD